MRRILYYVHQSLDGFIEGPNSEFDWAHAGERSLGNPDRSHCG